MPPVTHISRADPDRVEARDQSPHELRTECGDYDIAPVHPADAITALAKRNRRSLSDG